MKTLVFTDSYMAPPILSLISSLFIIWNNPKIVPIPNDVNNKYLLIYIYDTKLFVKKFNRYKNQSIFVCYNTFSFIRDFIH